MDLAWGGSAALAASGMMNIFRREGGENDEMHTAVVIRQHHGGSCDVRLLDDLATTVRSVHAQFSNATLDSDAHARVSACVRECVSA